MRSSFASVTVIVIAIAMVTTRAAVGFSLLAMPPPSRRVVPRQPRLNLNLFYIRQEDDFQQPFDNIAQRRRRQPRQDEPHHHANNRHASADWLYNVRSMPKSGVLREIRSPVAAVFSWSVVVSLAQRILLRTGRKRLALSMSLPATAHSFLVSAMGLLLVFRTNSAYQRFYEGRKIWEQVLSNARNLSRMIQLYSGEVGPSCKRRIANLLSAYPYLLRHHIRPGCLCQRDEKVLANTPPEDLFLLYEQPDTAGGGRGRSNSSDNHDADDDGTIVASASGARPCWVSRRELPWSLLEPSCLPRIAKSANRPLWVCDRIGREIMSIPYGTNFTSRERLTLLKQVEKLNNAVGQCERIHQTSVPLNYARHALRSLTLWLFTLPFCLVSDFGLLTAPVTACVAWLLFGIYQIGYSIEDPFQGSLRLSMLCDAIRRDVLGVLKVEDSSSARESAYLLEGEVVVLEKSKRPHYVVYPTKSNNTAAVLWTQQNANIQQGNSTFTAVGLSS